MVAVNPSFSANLSLRYQQFELNAQFSIPLKGVTAIFGHSGCGKTTLLRCIAGLEKKSTGSLQFNNDTWQDTNTFTPAHKRPIGYVFQEASLFPHLSIQGNLDFAIRRAGEKTDASHCETIIDMLDLKRLLHRNPLSLSGGERQRVAIARALLIRPKLLLMDEPLASLGQSHKQEILPYLEKLKEETTLPVLYVSHSAEEVARLADYLLVMDLGNIVAQGAITDMLSRLDFPLTLGDDAGVVFDAKVATIDRQWHLTKAVFPGGELWMRDSGQQCKQQVRIRVLARDISLSLQQHQDTSIVNCLPAIITEMGNDQHPGQMMIKLRVGEIALIARITKRSAAHLKLTTGMNVYAQIKSVAIVR
ncbi:MAG: molybdenum ABC transporter ATP-binding protein [Pseudomonadales bacterium]|nr:molybdenum ABC transporter ATP-binding protein [Pseudomonadales bacterium]